MMPKRCLLLLSSSVLHGYPGLFTWAEPILKEFLSSHDVKRILFIPYALKDHHAYTEKVANVLKRLGYDVVGIESFEDPILALKDAQAIYIGGGNTFRLLKLLYDKNLIQLIRKRVLEDGVPYIGSSAGTNVATASINTTNDMPIVYPPSFTAINLVPFNINPHYMDPDVNSKHMGETREKRITQYHEEEDTPPVLGLREGSLIHIEGYSIKLRGMHPARLFVRGEDPKEFEPNSDLSFLLK